MESIIITVTNPKKEYFYDLAVPTELEAEKLLKDICEAINGINPSLMLDAYKLRLFCVRRKEYIYPNATLTQAMVRNGDYITLASK